MKKRMDREAKRRTALRHTSDRRTPSALSEGAVRSFSDLNRRFVAAFLALVFAISCMVVGFNFATKAADSAAGSDDSNLVTNKTLSFNATTGKYDLTLEAYAKGKTAEKPVPLDIALVIDQSGSMITGDMGETYAPIGSSSTKWTVSGATSGEQYYYKVGSSYYPVQAEIGTIYQQASRIQIYDTFGSGHDGVSLGVNGAPTHFNVPTNYYVRTSDGTMHKMFVVTVGGFAQYYCYPYYYTSTTDTYNNVAEWDESIYWAFIWRDSNLERSSTWKSLKNAGRVNFVSASGSPTSSYNNMTYSWFSDGSYISGLYQISANEEPNRLYYTDENGEKHYLGNTVNLESDTAYTGQLYRATGVTRLEALKEAVSEFSETVAQDARDNNVDHRIAMIGFAGNQTPALSVTGGTANYSGNNREYDYVNTGLFLDGDFKSYKEITTYNYISYSAYINRHYYIQDSGTYVPVYYATNGYWYRITGGYPVTQGTSDSGDASSSSGSTRKFYEVITTYQPLTDSNYHDALISAKDNDSTSNGVNDYIDQSIAKLGDYGGTYTSYGITMANKVFENNPIPEGETRKRIIVVFTDGEPGGNGYEEAIAGEALSDGITAKEENGATVYTIGLFKSTPKTEVEEFMNALSSNSSVSRVNTYASDNKTASTNYGCGDLDPSAVYYYQNSDGKTYSVQTKRNKQSSLGWWAREETSTGTVYWTTMPYEDSSDNRTGRETFYSDASCSTAVYSPQYGTTYYTKDSYGVYETRYEYRWYDSDNRICEPMTSASDTDEDHIQFFALSAPTSSGTTGYYMPVSTASTLKAAFTSITESISGTQLDSTAILRDVVNTTTFDMTGATVTCYTALGTQATENGDITFSTETLIPSSSGITAAWDTTNTNQLDVTGFDYSANYIAYGKEANETEGTTANQGKKLIVKIQGLTPIATGNGLTSNTSAGIYTPGESGAEDTEIATFTSPMLDRQPLTLHVGDYDPDACFSATLTLEPVSGKTADYTHVIFNDGSLRAVFGSGSSNVTTWRSGSGTDVAVDNETAYLEYIRNGANDMTASDYTLSAAFVPVNEDASLYMYYYALMDGGTPTVLDNTSFSLGTDGSAKDVYITADVIDIPVTGILDDSHHNRVIYILAGAGVLAAGAGAAYVYRRKDEFAGRER